MGLVLYKALGDTLLSSLGHATDTSQHPCFVKCLLCQGFGKKKKAYDRNLKIPMIKSQICLQTIFII